MSELTPVYSLTLPETSNTDDPYYDAPWCPKELKQAMLEHKMPFAVIAVRGPFDKADKSGAFWKIIVQFDEFMTYPTKTGQMEETDTFALSFDAVPWRNRQLGAVQELLDEFPGEGIPNCHLYYGAASPGKSAPILLGQDK